MRRNMSAATAAAEVPLCRTCLQPHHAGLCPPCSRHVLPQLKLPAWHRDAHRGDRHTGSDAVSLTPEPSADVVKQQRKATKRDARRIGLRNFERQLAGVFTKNGGARVEIRRETFGPFLTVTA